MPIQPAGFFLHPAVSDSLEEPARLTMHVVNITVHDEKIIMTRKGADTRAVPGFTCAGTGLKTLPH